MRAATLLIFLFLSLSSLAQLPPNSLDGIEELRTEREYDKIISICNDLLTTYPGNPLVINQLANAQSHLREYSNCLSSLERINENSPDFTPIIQIETLAIKGSAVGYQGKGTEADSIFNVGHELIINQQMIGSQTYDLYSSWAENSFFTGEPLRALEQMTMAGQKLEQIDATHENWAQFHSNIGVVNWELGRLHSAALHMNKALEISEQHLESDNPQINTLINNLGVLYYHSGDSERALEYYQLAHSRTLKEFGPDYSRLTLTHNNMARIFGEQGRYDEAHTHIERSIFIANASTEPSLEQLTDALELKGRFLREQGQPTEALKVLNELLALYPEDLTGSSSRLSDVWKSHGNSLFDLGQLEEAKSSYRHSLAILSEERGGNKSKRSEALVKLSQVELETGNYPEALDLAMQAVEAVCKKDSADIGLSNLEPHRYSVHALSNLGDVKRAQKSIDEAVHFYSLGIELLDSLRLQASSFESRRHLASVVPELHSSRISCLSLNDMEAEALFSMYEGSKSYSLNLVFDAIRARDLEGVDDALLAEEEAITNEITYWKDRLMSADSTAESLCNERLFDLRIRDDSLDKVISQTAPGYYALRQETPTFNLAELRSELESSAFISHFTTGEKVFALCVTQESLALVELDCPELHETIEQFKKASADIEWILTNPTESDRLFIRAGRQLYDQLIVPLPSFALEPSRLLISPHGILQGVNFSLLLTSDVPEESPDYSSLPYLLKDKEVGYLWSVKQLGLPSHAEDQRLGIWANTGSDKVSIAAVNTESGFLTEIASSMLFSGNTCSESTFKKDASDFSWLHLACHGHVSENYQEFYLEVGANKEEDGHLTFGELTGMRLNAEHVTLSACKSGQGQGWKSETTTSIATGFALAGCPSVTMSLWNANDVSATLLMKSYYQHLTDGQSKTYAMQQAQLEFLKSNQDPLLAHPYYWGSFVVFGDPGVISSTYSHFNWITMTVLIIGLLWGAYVLRFYLRK